MVLTVLTVAQFYFWAFYWIPVIPAFFAFKTEFFCRAHHFRPCRSLLLWSSFVTDLNIWTTRYKEEQKRLLTRALKLHWTFKYGAQGLSVFKEVFQDVEIPQSQTKSELQPKNKPRRQENMAENVRVAVRVRPFISFTKLIFISSQIFYIIYLGIIELKVEYWVWKVKYFFKFWFVVQRSCTKVSCS